MSAKNTASPDLSDRFVDLILRQFDRNDECIDALQGKCSDFHTEIELLKFKVLVIGAIGGAVGTFITTTFFLIAGWALGKI